MLKLPENFETYAEARKAGFIKMKEIKDNGGRIVGVYCSFVPQELLIAAGAAAAPLCASSDEPIPAAETKLPRNLCPLIKASYGFALTDTCPYFYFSDFIVGETTCDGKKKAYEILGEDVPMYIMDVPQMKREKDILKWKEEIVDFANAAGALATTRKGSFSVMPLPAEIDSLRAQGPAKEDA